MGKCVGVCDFNYLDEDYVAQRRTSSEKAAYPSDNVYDLQRRTKIWRSDGFFQVIDGENEIVFQEQAGVNLTATVAPGEYATPLLFFAAVKTALEAVGAATYTVDTASNGKNRIASNLGGGATVFRLMTTEAAFAEMAEILGFGTDADFTGASTYTADVLRLHTEEWLEWDLGFPTNPEAFILASDRNKPLKITPNCVVKLQANWTRNWDAPSVDLTVPYDEFVLALWSQNFAGLAPLAEGYRYWRVSLSDPENPRRFLEFGLCYLGHVYVTERGCSVFPLEFGPQDLSTVNYAEAGQGFGQELPNTMGIDLTWNALTKQEERELRFFFERQKRTRAFFIILDSVEQADGTGAFSENNKDWVKLVKFQVEPRYRLGSPNFYEASWALREEL